MSVLQAIGNMSSNAVSGATTLQDLAGSIVESFIPLLTTEGTFGLNAVYAEKKFRSQDNLTYNTRFLPVMAKFHLSHL